MLKNREDLEKRIKIIMFNNLSPRADLNKLVEKFKKHNIISSDVNDIVSGRVILTVVDKRKLCLLTKYLYEITGDETIDYKKYFTELEIKEAESYKVDLKSDELKYIIFNNVVKYDDENYSTKLTLEENAKLWDDMKILYNPKTQRPRITTKSGYKEINLNHKNRSEIEERIVKGDQIPNDIYYNIPEAIDFKYDEKTRQLIVYGKVDIIDGFTRSMGGWFAYKRKQNSDFYFILNIKHWDEQKCLNFIEQQSRGSKLDPLATKSYDVTSAYNKIINKINTANNSYLKGKISSDGDEIKKNKLLIPFDIMFDTLKNLYPNLDKDGETTEVIKIQKNIIDKLNFIIENNLVLLENEQSYLLWVAYLMVVKDFDNESDIINIVDCIDKNTLNDIPYKIINKKTLHRIGEEIKKCTTER